MESVYTPGWWSRGVHAVPCLDLERVTVTSQKRVTIHRIPSHRTLYITLESCISPTMFTASPRCSCGLASRQMSLLSNDRSLMRIRRTSKASSRCVISATPGSDSLATTPGLPAATTAACTAASLLAAVAVLMHGLPAAAASETPYSLQGSIQYGVTAQGSVGRVRVWIGVSGRA